MDEQVNNKYIKRIFIILLLIITLGGECQSQQTALMPSDGYWYVWTVDDGILYDDGYMGNYKNNGLGALTVYPTVGYTSFEFVSFDVEYEPSACGWDYLEVYHGETLDSLIGRYCGTTIPPIINSTDPSGALTLLWSSDFSVSRSGFIISIQTQGGALPIELISFTAEYSGGYVEVDWTVASESNNNYFTIERSVDCYSWDEIERIEGLGTHNHHISYNYSDTRPVMGISYYRLKQTDYDGNFETFNPVSVTIEVDRYIVRTINLKGQEVDRKYKGMVIDIYNDNTTTKRMQNE